MASISSNGTGGGNSNSTSTWAGGVVPTSVDDVLIVDGDTVTQNAAHTFNSLKLETGSQWTADGSNHLTLDGENASDFALQIVDGTYVHANGTIVINNGGGGIAHAAVQGGVATSTNGIYDLTISGGGTTCEIYGTTTIHRNMEAGGSETVLRGDLTIKGTLTVSATLDTNYSINYYNLTVEGDCTVSGGTLEANAASGATVRLKSLTVSSGTYSATGGETIITGETSSGRAVDIVGTFTPNSGTLSIQTPADTLLRWPSSSSAHHLRINDASCVARPTGDNKPLIGGNLTVSAGEFNTLEGGQNHALTVTGEVNVAGTLTCNSSVCSFGSLDSTGLTNLADDSGSTLITSENSDGLSIVAGTFGTCVPAKIKHNNGTVTFNNHSDPATHAAIVCGNSNATDGLYNVIIDGANTIVDTYDPGGAGQECKIHNNFTVTNGSFQVNGASNPFDVGGDVLVSAGKMFGDGAAPTGAMSFGSLTIDNGAEFKATSATTTITGIASSWSVDLVSGGTFNNSDGTFLFNSASDQKVRLLGTGNFHNVTVNKSDNDMVQGSNLTIEGDLSITLETTHTFRPNSTSHTLTVTGGVTIVEGKLGDITNYTGAISFGSLSIEDGGTYIATSGTTTITGGGHCFTDKGTFTHNDGKVEFTATGDNAYIGDSSTQETVFYDLFPVVEAGYHLAVYKTITVARELHIDTDRLFKINCGSRAVTLKLGTSSSAGEIHQDGGGFQFASNTSNAAKIMAVDTTGLNPWINVAGYNIDWDSGGSGSDVELENGNYSGTTATGGGGVTIKLTGDMEFDGVTVSSGDTLDLNGKRAEFTGAVTYQGTIDADGLMIFHSDFTKYGTLNNAASGDIMTMSTSGHPTFSYITGYRTFFVNGGVQLGTGGFTNVPNAIMASGILKTGTRDPTATNFTIATGAEFQAEDNTLTVAGDFTTSGGLIGKSALTFDGTDDYVDLDNNVAWQFGTNNFTLEAWFKSDSGSGNRTIIANGDASDNGFLLYMQSSNNIKFFVNNIAVCNAADVSYEDGKWHHVAAVRDGNDYLLYIDGKLKDKSTQSAQNLTHAGKASIGARDLSASADAYWEGEIAMVRVFKGASGGARTQAEIRADMFNNSASLADSTDLMCAYDFNEGTGSEVVNIQGNTNFDGDITGAAWVGAGTFTYGTSTLVMAKSGTQKLTYLNGEDVYNLTINDGSTTQLISPDSSAGILDIYGNLIVNEKLEGSGVDSEQIKIRGSGKTLTIGSDVRTTAMADLTRMYIDESITIPESTHKRIVVNGNTTTAGGDLTITVELEVNSGTTFNANGKTITSKLVDMNGTSTLNVGSSTLVLSHTSGLTSESGVSLNGGPGTTISGSSAATTFESQNNWKVVGNVENLDVTNEELRVTGKVINCTGDIIQQHPSIDANQQLDYDTADDRDVMIGRDLDKNTELVN
jgi:hypothetical protein